MKILNYLSFIVLMLSLFIGCGSDYDDDTYIEPPVTAELEKVSPPSGLTIAVNTFIVLEFDKKPENFQTDAPNGFRYGNDVADLKGNLPSFSRSAKNVVILSPLTLGNTQIMVSWGPQLPQQSITLTYTFVRPDCCEPIMVGGGTVKDGDTDVNAEHINTDGILEIEFTANITGTIALQTESGDDVGWIGKVEGNRAKLELVKGREIQNATTYLIVGKVSDALDNELEFEIKFSTKAKV